MLYQKNREGEQGNPFRAGPTGLIPKRPWVSPGSRATSEHRDGPPVDTTQVCTLPLRCAHGCRCVFVHRWVCTGLLISRFPNRCIGTKGPGPLSLGRDARALPCGSFFVQSAQEASFPLPRGGGLCPFSPGTGGFSTLGTEVWLKLEAPGGQRTSSPQAHARAWVGDPGHRGADIR